MRLVSVSVSAVHAEHFLKQNKKPEVPPDLAVSVSGLVSVPRDIVLHTRVHITYITVHVAPVARATIHKFTLCLATEMGDLDSLAFLKDLVKHFWCT